HETSQPSTDQGITTKITINPELAVRKSWTPRDITRHTKRINQQDSLREIERELQGKPIAVNNRPPVKRVKWPTNLPPVDIYCIGAIGFYRTLTKPDVTPFVTSLYEIDRIIEEKEAEAI